MYLMLEAGAKKIDHEYLKEQQTQQKGIAIFRNMILQLVCHNTYTFTSKVPLCIFRNNSCWKGTLQAQ